MSLDPALRELLAAALDLNPDYVDRDHGPMVVFHPYSERAGYSPSRVWVRPVGSIGERDVDVEDTAGAIGRFRTALETVMANLPKPEHDALMSEVLHVTWAEDDGRWEA